MIYRYEIRNNGKEDILYLYLEMSYEFSKELSNGSDDHTSNKIKDFISNNSISFNGKKIYLVTDGIIIKAYELNKDEEKKEIKEKDYSNDGFIINLKYNQKIIKVSLKTYLLGVIAANSIDNLELTTLKCLALLYRTYAYKQMKEENVVNSINKFQIYKPISYYKLLWQNNYKNNYNKIEKAINDTDGEFITYNNNYILPYIHVCNNGSTNNGDEEYLERRASLWDYSSPYYLDIKDYDFPYLEELFSMKKDKLKSIEILEVTKSKYIEKIKVGSNIYTGETFRNILNLNSADINIIINPTYVRFITKGWGNNLGLSQFGANEIAKIGCSYTSIIKYYFPKVSIKKYIKK